MFIVFLGEFATFAILKETVEDFITNIWGLLDLNGDGKLTELAKQDEVKLSLKYLLKILDFLFEKFDIHWDDELSALDWNEVTGRTGRDKSIGRKLISLPSPIYRVFTRIDTNRDDVLRLEEVHIFMKKLFYIFDKDEDCIVDLGEIIFVLDEHMLPKEFQLGLKLLAKKYLTIANYIFNRILNAADTNFDGETELEEVIDFPNDEFLESEVEGLLMLSKPDEELISYLFRRSSIPNIGNPKGTLVEIKEGQSVTLHCPVFQGMNVKRLWKKDGILVFPMNGIRVVDAGSALVITIAHIEHSGVWSCKASTAEDMDSIEFTVRVAQLHEGSEDPWLQTIRSLMMNKVFDMDVNNLKCR